MRIILTRHIKGENFMIEILNAIANFFKLVGGFLGVDLIAIIAFGLLIVIMFIAQLVSVFSVESATNRKVKQINGYLTKNPFVTDENIVEFNRIMKHRMPKAMRYQWQKYMVNRDKKPSNYLTEDNCITKPFRTSGFLQSIKQFKYGAGFLSVASFTLILGAFFNNSSAITNTSNLIEVLLKSLIIPAIIVLISVLFVSLMNAKRNSTLNELFYNFDQLQHSLDRAVTSFPPFVDYEILFTRKEIVAGIPALQEYLQQRAEYEQEQIEKARLSQVEHENFDFSKLGVKGTLIMERTMKECEFYLGNRKILLADIDNLQSQKDLLTKNYDEKNRGNQRKLRDIKESIDRLREKLNTTTNKIVGNDIIRQQAEEVKKQQLIEKEMDDDNNHYNQELAKLDEQIDKKRKEIEDNKKLVENTLINDFKDYSDKIYEELKNIADTNVSKEIDDLKQVNKKLESDLEDREQYIVQRNAMYEEKVKESEDAEYLRTELEQLKKDIIIKNQEIIGANKEVESRAIENRTLQREIQRLKKEKYHEVYRYFDNNGIEFFYDDNGEPFYFDNDGQMVYYTGQDKIDQLKAYKQIEEQLKTENELDNLQQEAGGYDDVQDQFAVDSVDSVDDSLSEQLDSLQAENITQPAEKEAETAQAEQEQDDNQTNKDPQEAVALDDNASESQNGDEKQEQNKLSQAEIDMLNALESEPETTNEQESNLTNEQEIKNLEQEISTKNDELEQQYSKLQQQLAEAEKVVDKKPSQKPKKEKKTTKQKLAEKVTPKKETKPVERTPKKRKNKDFVFKVKKAPKSSGGDSGFDTSIFDNIGDDDK